jgi:hypothetical protein
MKSMESDKPKESREKKSSSAKKPYRRPEILYREKLEVMAAVCAPSPPAKTNPGTCPSGPANS